MVLVHAGKGLAEHSCCCLASHGGHISTTGSICPSANAACLPKKSGVQVFCFQRVQRVHIFPPFTSRPNSQALRSKEKKPCQRWCHTQTHQFLSNWFKVSFIFGALQMCFFFWESSTHQEVISNRTVRSCCSLFGTRGFVFFCCQCRKELLIICQIFHFYFFSRILLQQYTIDLAFFSILTPKLACRCR